MKSNRMRNLLLIVVSVIALILPSACASDADADAVAKKIEKNEALTQEDYGVMLDYLKPAMEQLVKFIEMGADNNDLEGLDKEFPHSELFMKTIGKEEHNFDTSNMEKAQKLTELYMKAIKEAAKKQGVDLDALNNGLPEDVPGITDEVNYNTPAD